jgi:putative SOS response-associated peptidase YedK
MCNEQRRRVAIGQIRDDFSKLRIPLRFPEGVPNLAPLDSIRITDTGTIVRAAKDEAGAAELVQRRWSWPGPGGRPVYNYRSEGRGFERGRCLIVADGFYEFTVPKEAGRKRKDKWLFTKAGEDWFAIAGYWRRSDEVGEAYAMLTVEPGPDVAPFHSRQVVVIERSDWSAWLDRSNCVTHLLRPSPAGTFDVAQVPN